MQRTTSNGPCTGLGLSGVLAALAVSAAPAWGSGEPTALEAYVYEPDPAYGYELMEVLPGLGYTAYVLLMDSLEWRAPEEVDRTLWTHQVVLLVPDVITTDTALLLVNGGSDPLDPVDDLVLELGAPIALLTGSILAAVSQIPNQPLAFADEAGPISEDALVAYSWDKLMLTGEAEWAAYLPMTKASVRAMDTVQEFVLEEIAGAAVTDFVVTGFSKRGATAWLVAAVDDRVRAVAPGVFDILDMAPQIERHFEAYGFYSSAIQDYVDYDIVSRPRSPEGVTLGSIVDPLSYAQALDMPKLILTATGDQFFLPDAANLYLDRLPGETLVRQIPNTDHGLTNGEEEAFLSLLSWYEAVLADAPRPDMSWGFDSDGTLRVVSDTVPLSAQLWQATNEIARDFRLDVFGANWTATALTAEPDGSFVVAVPAPPQGWTGYLVEIAFPGVTPGVPQTYTTPVFVTPEDLPFTLADPVGDPRMARYWRCQLPVQPDCDADFSEEELEALLPFPVFGTYLTALADLEAVIVRTQSPEERARRACSVSRLNHAAEALGWYSDVDLGPAGRGLMWELYDAAEASFAAGEPDLAREICSRLNLLPGNEP